MGTFTGGVRRGGGLSLILELSLRAHFALCHDTDF